MLPGPLNVNGHLSVGPMDTYSPTGCEMRILLDNVNLKSSSGPNSFGRKLAQRLIAAGHVMVEPNASPDVQLSFIQMNTWSRAPLVQRLDGIYFNSRQDWQALNGPIMDTYERATAVIFQSDFNRRLSERYFGPHRNGHVINNGTDIVHIANTRPLKYLDNFENVWCCASSWRPHKRLSENVRYFMEHAGPSDCLVIAGGVDDTSKLPRDERIFFVGDLPWETLISLYRRSKYFIHLAFLDHCPNVVVDARAAGCHIICTSSGGTQEVAGLNSTIIEELVPWDMSPLDLYVPPALDFSRKLVGTYDKNISIETVADQYIDIMRSVANV